ncbi:hypothetical protein K2173_003551 [Erythroxylum novogranatense]|uniref:Methyltransferase type 11 domain-containing protein n=1 Tax=Erythroxylum novogranatense TaxID=1862640 RepID=A0AAV8TCP7_9ROSI|nr:hypothetical protein K2173_003551 [Erythroxylum novogranatense]
MEKRMRVFLNKISIVSSTVATIIVIILVLHKPKTCVPSSTSNIKPHLKFPTSTCDPSLSRPHLSLSKKNHRLWFSKSWLSQVASYTTFFQSLHILRNHSRVLCVSSGAGHDVMALNNMGVVDVTGVELVDSLPLVKRADPNNLPFPDGIFDLAFSAHLKEALFPVRYVGEMERTVRRGGVVVVVLDECEGDTVDGVVGMFNRSMFVGADNVTLIGSRMTRIVMRVTASISSSSLSHGKH